MNYQTVRLVSTFGSGNCVSNFGLSLKVETAAVSSFGPFPVLGLYKGQLQVVLSMFLNFDKDSAEFFPKAKDFEVFME